jgi:hypothetical protein
MKRHQLLMPMLIALTSAAPLHEFELRRIAWRAERARHAHHEPIATDLLDTNPARGCLERVSPSPLMDWPDGQDMELANTIQGVTHDEGSWYLSSAKRRGRLARVPRDADLTRSPDFIDEPFPGWHHPGDMDHSDGWIYIALEHDGGSAERNAIAAVPTATFHDKSTYKVFQLEGGPQRRRGTMPWIARYPGTDYFYSSTFRRAGQLQRYKASFDASGAPTGFTRCGVVHLTQHLHRVQGGAFGPDGRLYLSTDPHDLTAIQEGAIKVLDMSDHTAGQPAIDCAAPPTTRAPLIQSIYVHKRPGVPPLTDEIEGITYWDLDRAPRPLGQLHTLMIDQDWPDADDLSIKHIRLLPHGGVPAECAAMTARPARRDGDP